MNIEHVKTQKIGDVAMVVNMNIDIEYVDNDENGRCSQCWQGVWL